MIQLNAINQFYSLTSLTELVKELQGVLQLFNLPR